jgi:hypothetical protein
MDEYDGMGDREKVIWTLLSNVCERLGSRDSYIRELLSNAKTELIVIAEKEEDEESYLDSLGAEEA